MVTSAKSRGGRDAVPAKITSSMPAPRIDLALLSPITQRMASSKLDLPQPLGPTIPVSPLSLLSSAGSTKLLKPTSFSFFIRNGLSPLRLWCCYAPPEPYLACAGLDQLALDLVPSTTVKLRAVQQERRRTRYAIILGATLCHFDEIINRSFIRQA